MVKDKVTFYRIVYQDFTKYSFEKFKDKTSEQR